MFDFDSTFEGMDDEDAGSLGPSAAEEDEALWAMVGEFVKAMLTNLDSLPVDRIQVMSSYHLLNLCHLTNILITNILIMTSFDRTCLR